MDLQNLSLYKFQLVEMALILAKVLKIFYFLVASFGRDQAISTV